MGNTHKRYAPEYRQRMVELVRAGRHAEELAREFHTTSQSIRNWVAQANRDEGRRRDGLTSDSALFSCRTPKGRRKSFTRRRASSTPRQGSYTTRQLKQQ
jgi:transposase-like protein